MLRKVVILCLIAALYVNAALIKSVQENNVEVLYLDYPSFVTEFHTDYVTNTFYAFGGRIFRQLTHANNFTAIDNQTLWAYDQPFLDVAMLTHPTTHQLWAVGPSLRDDRGNIGFFLPITVVGPGGINHYYQGDHRGFIFSAVSVDFRNLTHVLAYFAGFGPSDVQGSDAVDFLLVRARMNLMNFTDITWSNTSDTGFLQQNTFHPYCDTFKPKVWHDWRNNKTFIWKPEDRLLFRVDTDPNGNEPLVVDKFLNLSTYGYRAGHYYHWRNDTLIFGFQETGRTNGTLIAVDLRTFLVTQKLTFPGNYSFPRAIAGVGSTLYVGFEGGPGVVSVDVNTFKIKGFVELPSHLNQVYSAWDEDTNYIYFSTYEQHTKVFRIDKGDFCSSECWGWGSYCHRGLCRCADGLELSQGACTPEKQVRIEKEYHTEEGAAIAMGILFALMTIAAVAGWVMWYRTKSGNYQRVM